MDRVNVLRKIAALKRLAAVDSGGTPAERGTAARMAAKLIYEHDIELHELADPPGIDEDGVVFSWTYSY